MRAIVGRTAGVRRVTLERYFIELRLRAFGSRLCASYVAALVVYVFVGWVLHPALWNPDAGCCTQPTNELVN